MSLSDHRLSSAQIAWRAAQDIADGSYVNLGIGIPEMVARYQPAGREVVYHSENGLLGFGPPPEPGSEDWDLINAGKKAVTLTPGASFFDHAQSFAMVRGGHLDLAILGAFQVSQRGDLANWRLGDAGVPAIGGAMDLVHGAKQVFVLTEHVARDGSPKLVENCTFPLTGLACVDRIYTSCAVIDVVSGRFVLREIVPGLSFEALQAMTGAKLDIGQSVAPLSVPDVRQDAAGHD